MGNAHTAWRRGTDGAWAMFQPGCLTGESEDAERGTTHGAFQLKHFCTSLKQACNAPTSGFELRRRVDDRFIVRGLPHLMIRRLSDMPDKRTSSNAAKTKTDTHEVYSPQNIARPGIQYLTEITDGDEDYCVMLLTFPPGAVVPLHSHADRETFYIISGNSELFRGDRWETLGPGETADVQDGIRHAWRNLAESTTTALCVTTMRMARFLRDISADDGSSDPSMRDRRFQSLVQKNGYWLANPQESAAIGLDVNWSGGKP
jgi:quercetin dioxygenase-like cupin family protein